MTKTEAQNLKLLYGESFSLNPSALVTLFQIYIGDISFSRGIINSDQLTSSSNTFYFHNNIKLSNSSIFWQGKEYVAAPIFAEGFEITSKGVLPTPKLSLTVSDDGISQLSILKDKILQLGDLVGAKVTRIRTLASFLDAENFYGSTPPANFSPNPNQEFPRDVYYIDRKSLENKNIIEFELASLLDVQNVKLPGRLVVANTCNATYRGCGCYYEFASRRNINEHGTIDESTLPTEAPPIATEFNEQIVDLLSGINIIDKGAYDKNLRYNSGEYVYIENNNVKYYFVANGVEIPYAPPNRSYWIPELCSKQIIGCELRFGQGGGANGGVVPGQIPFNGFPAATRFK